MDLARPPPVSGSGRTFVLGGSGLFCPALPSAAAGHLLIRHGPTTGPHWHAVARRCGQRRIRLAVHHESRQNRQDRFLSSGVARHGRTGTGARQARRHWRRFMKFSNRFHPAPRPWTARRVPVNGARLRVLIVDDTTMRPLHWPPVCRWRTSSPALFPAAMTRLTWGAHGHATSS